MIKHKPTKWNCPKCGTEIEFPNRMAMVLASRAGGCQGCRALETFKRNPGMAMLVVDFWQRTNSFPASDSWTKAPVFGYGGVQ